MPEVTIAPPTAHSEESRIIPECRSFGEAWLESVIEISARKSNIAIIDDGTLRQTLSNQHLDDYHTVVKELPLSAENILTSSLGISLQSAIPFISLNATGDEGKIFDILSKTLEKETLNLKIANFSDSPKLLNILGHIPKITIIRPGDFFEAKRLIHESAAINGVVYFDMSNIQIPTITNEFVSLKIGEANKLREGSDLTLVCSGQLAYECFEAGRLLEERGIKIRFLHLPTIHPLDINTLIDSAENTEHIVVAENVLDDGIMHKNISHRLTVKHPIRIDLFEAPMTLHTSAQVHGDIAREITKYIEKIIHNTNS